MVATGGRIGYTFYTPATANTSFWHRTPHKLGGPVSEIQVGFMDWMYTDKTETANADNDVTITFAWLERASTGQVVPLTFSGSRQLVLPMNSTTAHWLADAIPSSVWTGSAPVRDELFWLHAKGAIPEGGKLPVGTSSAFPPSRPRVHAAHGSSAFSMAAVTSALSGACFGSKRASGLPSLPMRNFPKFHFTSPGNAPPSPVRAV